MLKRFLLFFLFFSLFTNCKVREKPEFLRLENVKIVDSNIKNITLSADALFLNKNNVGGSLKTDDLRIYVNDKEVAKVITEKFNVPSQQNFKIPLTVTVATDSLIDQNSIGGILSSLISQKLKVQYKGAIKYKILGFSSTYSIDESQNIKIKL